MSFIFECLFSLQACICFTFKRGKVKLIYLAFSSIISFGFGKAPRAKLIHKGRSVISERQHGCGAVEMWLQNQQTSGHWINSRRTKY